MIITTIGEEAVAIVRVYPGDKWCKVIREDESVEWIKTSMIEESEV
jgi:hypothetical protein